MASKQPDWTSLSSLARTIYAYNPATDKTAPVPFSQLATSYPVHTARATKVSRVADFSGLGYCVYKAWHWGNGTPSRRTFESQARVARGQAVHEDREVELLDELEEVPVATAAQIRDPLVDIAELPEVRTRLRVGGLVYGAQIDGAARRGGNLVVREMKTGSHFAMMDHKLQAWAYCLAGPGAFVAAHPKFRAHHVWWTLDYPDQGRTWGPFPFTAQLQGLVLESMAAYEWVFTAGADGGDDFHLPFDPNPNKCRPCEFRANCRWAR